MRLFLTMSFFAAFTFGALLPDISLLTRCLLLIGSGFFGWSFYRQIEATTEDEDENEPSKDSDDDEALRKSDPGAWLRKQISMTIDNVKGDDALMGVCDSEVAKVSQTMAVAVTGLRLIAETLESHDDEFAPTVLIETFDKSSGGVVAGIEHFLLDDDAWHALHPDMPLPEGKHAKDFLMEIGLPRIALERDAGEVVLVIPAWMALSDTPEPEVRPSENPDRIEVVTVSRVTAKQVQVWTAPVGRDPRGESKPTLGSFEYMGSDGTSMLEPTRRALQAVAVAHAMEMSIPEFMQEFMSRRSEDEGSED